MAKSNLEKQIIKEAEKALKNTKIDYECPYCKKKMKVKIGKNKCTNPKCRKEFTVDFQMKK